MQIRMPISDVEQMRFSGMSEEEIGNEIQARGVPHPDDLSGWRPEAVAEYLAFYAGVPYAPPKPAAPPLEVSVREFWDKALSEAPDAPEIEAAFRDVFDVPVRTTDEKPEPTRPAFIAPVRPAPAPTPHQPSPVIAPAPPPMAPVAPERLEILDLVEKVIDSDRRRNRVNEYTARGFRTSISLFCEIMRIRYADEITQQVIEDFCAALDRLPPDYRRGSVGRATPIWDIIAKAEKDGVPVGLSAKTVNKQLEAIKKLIRHAKAHRVEIPGVEISILRVRDPEPDKEKRDPFTRDEVRSLFKQPRLNLSSERTALFWVSHVAAYTGARKEEIAAMVVDDVEEREGIPVMIIRTNDMRGLKNGQSSRVVPVHPDLIEMGFVDYAKAREPGLLFDLKKKGRKYGDDIDYYWQKVRKSVVGDNPRKVFHSFRHYAVQTLKDEGVRVGFRAELSRFFHREVSHL